MVRSLGASVRSRRALLAGVGRSPLGGGVGGFRGDSLLFARSLAARVEKNCSETSSWQISSVLSPTHHDDPTRAGELSPPAAQSLSQQFLCGDRHQGTGTNEEKGKRGREREENLAHLKIYIFCCALGRKNCSSP